MKESPMVKSVLQWVWKMADIAATDFILYDICSSIKYFWLNDSHLLKRPLGASSTVKSHKSQQSNATLWLLCDVMMGHGKCKHIRRCAPLLPCTWPPWQCYHSAPVVSCNGRHNCLTTKPNWPWLAAWLPTVPRKYRCRRGVVWWRDAAAGSRLGSCEGVTQNTHRRRGYTLQILCSPVTVKGLCSSNTLVH